MSRRARTYFGRIFYVALAGILVYSVAAPVLDSGATPSTSEYALLGRKLFQSFTWLQMLFLPLAAAVAASDIVSREARMGTLQLLLLTPLTGGRIIAGKWKAVMLETLTLALSSSPAMAISVYLGGVGVEDLAWCFCLSMVLSAVSAAMAIYYSLRDRTVVEAAFRATLMLQLSCLPYWLLFGIMTAVTGPSSTFVPFDVAAAIHPTCAWFMAANPAKASLLGAHAWISASVVSMGVAWYYLVCAAGHLARTPKILESPALQTPQERNPNDILWREPPGPVWERWPLLWKECALTTVRLSPSARAVLFVLFALLTLTCLFGHAAGAMVQLFLLCSVALILCVAVGSGHFARERERRGFEMLLSTPLRPSEVVAAKLVSGVIGGEAVCLGLFIVAGFASLANSGEVSGWVAFTVGAFLAFSYVLASAVSLWSKSYRSAFVTTTAILVFLVIGVPVLMNLLEGSAVSYFPGVQFASYALHPYRIFTTERPVPLREWVVPANLAAYVSATTLLIAGMIARFRSVAQDR